MNHRNPTANLHNDLVKLKSDLEDALAKATTESHDKISRLNVITTSLTAKLSELESEEIRLASQNDWNRKATRMNLLFTAILVIAAIAGGLIQANQMFILREQTATLKNQTVIQDGQTHLQKDHDSFEQDQRAVEITSHLGETWDSTFNYENRYRFERFRMHMMKWASNTETRTRSLSILIDIAQVSQAKILRSDANLMELIAPDLGCDSGTEVLQKDKKDYEIVRAAFRYRNTIIECLNTMEAVFSIRDNCQSATTKKIIKKQFTEIIKIWVDPSRKDSLKPYIDTYRLLYPAENPPAYQTLTNPDTQD